MPSSVRHRASLCAAAIALVLAVPQALQAAPLEYIGQQIVPTGTVFAGTTVGGLSGIDRAAGSSRFLAISDDRSSSPANAARFYELSLELGQFVRSATPGQAGVKFESVTTILTPAGAPFALNQVDPESLRIDPRSGNLYWTNEGQRAAAGLQNPTVREMSPSGTHVRDFAVPTRYNPAGLGAADPGIRNNLAFESLTLSVDGRTLYTATENALVQDGPAASLANGSSSRILSFDVASGAAGAEWVYPVSPAALAPNPAGGFVTNGLVELLAVGDRQFIAVERSFSAGAATPGVGPNGLPTGNTIRLYLVDARQASDVSGMDAINAGVVAATKTLLLDLSTLKNDDGSALATDNIEGIVWGPEFNGKPTLILVSDNNFGATQFTQFVALSVTSPIPEPAIASLMLPGLALLAWRRRQAARPGVASPH
ncbi:MAG: esterase-like activity of phytase family protein [Rubrivivax sp.]|nr:esterase-like activity of phytase family protein [Rubrivivax sp.]